MVRIQFYGVRVVCVCVCCGGGTGDLGRSAGPFRLLKREVCQFFGTRWVVVSIFSTYVCVEGGGVHSICCFLQKSKTAKDPKTLKSIKQGKSIKQKG